MTRPAVIVPFLRMEPGGVIELVVPRADGGRVEVWTIDDDVALLLLADLAMMLLRRRGAAARPPPGRNVDPV